LAEDLAFGTLGRAWVDVEGDFNFYTIHETTDASVKTITDDYLLKTIEVSSPWDNYRSKIILNGYRSDLSEAGVSSVITRYETLVLAKGESYTGRWEIENNYVYPFPAVTCCPSCNVRVYESSVDYGNSEYYDFVVNACTMDYLDWTLTNPSTNPSTNAASEGMYIDLDDAGTNYNYGVQQWTYETTDGTMPDNIINIGSGLFNIKTSSTNNTDDATDKALIDDIGNTLLNYLGTVRPYPIISYQGRYDEQFDMDLEDKVTLDLDTLNINGDYRITKISHVSQITPQDVKTTLWLYPAMELST
jgi:hypothetical protein